MYLDRQNNVTYDLNLVFPSSFRYQVHSFLRLNLCWFQSSLFILIYSLYGLDNHKTILFKFGQSNVDYYYNILSIIYVMYKCL